MTNLAQTSTPSRVTLSRTPARALTFLLGIGRQPVVRAQLVTRGYTPAEHARGWELLRAIDPMLGTSASNTGAAATSDPVVSRALAEVDSWDHQNLAIADVALRTREPAVHAYLFDGENASVDGVACVPVVVRFLDRVDALAAAAHPAHHAGHARRATDSPALEVPDTVTRTHAASALEILASRGITPDERAKVRGWLATVMAGTAPAPSEPTTAAPDASDAAMALYTWLDEWTTVAHRVLKRRDQLIALGLSERKPRKRKAATGAAAAPTPAARDGAAALAT